MDKNLIKKELYKQKPTADLNRVFANYKEYTCRICYNGQMKVIFFDVPIKECKFDEITPAILLIHWLV